jgi:hypothetical protein
VFVHLTLVEVASPADRRPMFIAAPPSAMLRIAAPADEHAAAGGYRTARRASSMVDTPLSSCCMPITPRRRHGGRCTRWRRLPLDLAPARSSTKWRAVASRDRDRHRPSALGGLASAPASRRSCSCRRRTTAARRAFDAVDVGLLHRRRASCGRRTPLP